MTKQAGTSKKKKNSEKKRNELNENPVKQLPVILLKLCCSETLYKQTYDHFCLENNTFGRFQTPKSYVSIILNPLCLSTPNC